MDVLGLLFSDYFTVWVRFFVVLLVTLDANVSCVESFVYCLVFCNIWQLCIVQFRAALCCTMLSVRSLICVCMYACTSCLSMRSLSFVFLKLIHTLTAVVFRVGSVLLVLLGAVTLWVCLHLD